MFAYIFYFILILNNKEKRKRKALKSSFITRKVDIKQSNLLILS